MTARPEPGAIPVPLALRGSPLVVALDDEAYTLSALRRALRGEPYELRTADDPARVLRWVASRDVSLVITDQRMPEMEGTDLLDEVRRVSPRTAGVILTAYPESLRMDEALRGWPRLVILKPWDDGWLRGTLRRLLAAGGAAPPRGGEDVEGLDFDLGGEA